LLVLEALTLFYTINIKQNISTTRRFAPIVSTNTKLTVFAKYCVGFGHVTKKKFGNQPFGLIAKFLAISPEQNPNFLPKQSD